MGTIPAREIKRRGISAVDEDLKDGPVLVIQHDEPRYVVLSVEQYQELREAQEEQTLARIREAEADVAAGRVRRMAARELIDEFDPPS
jgi:PHD/YefM family antitoxin component YafN of YafNO toxin-antitoxin module